MPKEIKDRQDQEPPVTPDTEVFDAIVKEIRKVVTPKTEKENKKEK